MVLVAAIPMLLLVHGTASSWQIAWQGHDPQRLAGILLKSIGTSLLVAIISTSLAFPVARLLARRAWPMGGTFPILFILPLLIPLTLHTGAWIFLGIGRGSSVLPAMSGRGLGLGPLASVIWIWCASLTPLAITILTVAMRTFPRSGEDAASLLPLRLMDRMRILLSWYRIPLVCSLLAITLITLNSHTVPSFFGEHFYAEEILTAFQSTLSPTAAAALSSLLLPVLCLILLLLTLLLRNWPEHAGVSVHGTRPRRPRPSEWLLIVAALGMFVIAPTAVLLHEAQWLTRLIPAAKLSAREAMASILTAGAAVPLALVIALPLAAAAFFARRSSPVVLLIDLVATAPLIIPHSLTAAALVGFWNHGDWRDVFYTAGFPHPLGLGIIFSTIPYWAVRYGMRTLPARYGDAASLAGISDLRRFSMIELRFCRRWLLGAMIAVLIASMMELEASMLLYSPGRMPLPVRIYNLLHYGRNADMATMCLIMILLAALPAVILRAAFRLNGTHHGNPS